MSIDLIIFNLKNVILCFLIKKYVIYYTYNVISIDL